MKTPALRCFPTAPGFVLEDAWVELHVELVVDIRRDFMLDEYILILCAIY